MNKLFTTCLVLGLLFLVGCAPKTTTKLDKFPLMYEETPQTILILPPINETTAADSKEHYSTTIQEPLCQAGFYVLPYEVTSDIFKMEGMYDAESMAGLPLAVFKEKFNADAVLYTTLKKWDVKYLVIASNLTVSIDCVLKSTTSERTLWEYNGTIVVDLSGGGGGGGLAGLLANAIVTAIKTASSDYVPYARMANYQAISALPKGKYHPRYQLDQGDPIFDQQLRAKGQ